MVELKDEVNQKGEFVRKVSTFRDTVTADGSSGFKAEKDRYHLYISYACPWAHRTLTVRALKGLQDVITYDVVHPDMGKLGWSFETNFDGSTGDSIHGFKHLREIYFKQEPDYAGRFTVPVLYDKKEKKIVNNESSEIIIMLNKEFNEFAKNPDLDLYPSDLVEAIEEVNPWIYDNINNGVYRCGFAQSQGAYETAYNNLFEHLDKAEEILSKQRYLTGNKLTLADIRLWVTLIRFDVVYYVHFKTCKAHIFSGYPNLWGFTRELYQNKEIQPTVNFAQIKHHYYYSHDHINPYRIVPPGPVVNFDEPHDRQEKFPI